MANVHFISDLHLQHRFVAELRGFSSVADHDACLFDNWCKAVRKGDQVWVLGDVAVTTNPASLAEIMQLLRKLPGSKHLLGGNHDICHPMHRDSHRRQGLYFTAFESVQTMARRRINGTEVLLSHFPYDGDHTDEPRYTQYRLRDEGRWLIHGHVHSKDRVVGRQVHIGVDAWDLAPVSLEQVAGLMENPT
jgi:calcineurin-like phosphoesterase family protein